MRTPTIGLIPVGAGPRLFFVNRVSCFAIENVLARKRAKRKLELPSGPNHAAASAADHWVSHPAPADAVAPSGGAESGTAVDTDWACVAVAQAGLLGDAAPAARSDCAA